MSNQNSDRQVSQDGQRLTDVYACSSDRSCSSEALLDASGIWHRAGLLNVAYQTTADAVSDAERNRILAREIAKATLRLFGQAIDGQGNLIRLEAVSPLQCIN